MSWSARTARFTARTKRFVPWTRWQARWTTARRDAIFNSETKRLTNLGACRAGYVCMVKCLDLRPVFWCNSRCRNPSPFSASEFRVTPQPAREPLPLPAYSVPSASTPRTRSFLPPEVCICCLSSPSNKRSSRVGSKVHARLYADTSACCISLFSPMYSISMRYCALQTENIARSIPTFIGSCKKCRLLSDTKTLCRRDR